MPTDVENILATRISSIPRDPNEKEIVRRFWKTASNQGVKNPSRINIANPLAPQGSDYSQVRVILPPNATGYNRYAWSRGPGGNFSGRKVSLPMPRRYPDGKTVLPPA